MFLTKQIFLTWVECTFDLSMIKKVAGVLIVLTVTALVILGYFFLKKQQVGDVHLLQLVPKNTVLYMEAPTFSSFFDRLNANNVAWEELSKVKPIGDLHNQGMYIDSLLSAYPEFSKMLGKTAVSLHVTGDDMHALYYAAILPDAGESDFLSFINKFTKYSQQKKFEGNDIFVFSENTQKKLYFSILNHVWVASYSMSWLEETCRAAATPNLSLASDSLIQRLLQTSGTHVHATVFLHVPRFYAFLSAKALQQPISILQEGSQLMSWVNVDVHLHTSSVLLNGFSFAGENNDWLSMFAGQKPVEPDIIRLLPENTAWFCWTGYNHAKEYHQKYLQFLEQKGDKEKAEEHLHNINKHFDTDMVSEWLDIIHGEWLIASMNRKTDSAAGNVFMLIRLNDSHDAVKRLRQSASNAEGWYEEEYFEYKIERFPAQQPFRYVLGEHFSSISMPYFTQLDGVLLLANDIEVLKLLLKQYTAGRTLLANPEYRAFSENTSSSCNMYFYSSVPAVLPEFTAMLQDTAATFMHKNAETFRKFQAFSWQVAYSKTNLFYHTSFLQYNPSYEEKESGLWELACDENLVYGPVFFTNHNTRAYDIIVQDAAHTLYLVSNTGKIHWKRTLNAPVIGEVKEVDMLQNGKKQLLFNTANKLYIIDRNGNDYKGFPYTLPAKATNGVAAFDYEKNGKYRFMLACSDMRIYNIDQSGKPVEGFTNYATTSPVYQTLVHVAAGGKDYIVLVENNGLTYALDRKGDLRHNFGKLALSGGIMMSKIEASVTPENIRVAAIDSSGMLAVLYFNGKQDTFRLSKPGMPVSFERSDLNGNKLMENISFSMGHLLVADENKKKIFSQEFPGMAPGKVVLSQGKKPNILCVYYEGTEDVYTYYGNGNELSRLNLPGIHNLIAGDMNNDKTLNIIYIKGNILGAVNVP